MLLQLLSMTLLLFEVVYCQDACEKITTDVLGNSNTFEATGLIATILNPGGDAVDPEVRIIDMNIVCEAQDVMEDRYRYTSVVVSFNCFSTDVRISECNDNSTVHTEQFDFGCSGGTWTTNILSISSSARTANPIATLTTELDTGCILCINPASPVVGSRVVSNVTHCEACSNCPMGLQRCYYNASFSEVCCNFMYLNICVTECPNSLAANPLNEFICESQCDVLADDFGTFEFTNGRFNGSVATLTCMVGYEVSNSPATCGPTGWSSTPTCSSSSTSTSKPTTAATSELPSTLTLLTPSVPPNDCGNTVDCIIGVSFGVIIGVLVLLVIVLTIALAIVLQKNKKLLCEKRNPQIEPKTV